MSTELPASETKKIVKYSNSSATHYQYSDSVTLYVEKDPRHSPIHEVGVGEAMVTTDNGLLFTSNLGPCQAVVAKLKDGNFALYHARNPDSCEQGFKDFIKYTKGNIDEIFVFQKPDNKNNLLKAPVLAVELSIALGIDVPRVQIPKYGAIVCDSQHNKAFIIKFNQFNLIDATISQPAGVVLSNATSLDSAFTTAIPYYKSEEEVINYKEVEGSKLYAEARLGIALYKKDFNLAKRAKSEIIQKALNLWITDSYHASNREIIKNFNEFGLVSTSTKIKTQPIIKIKNQPIDEKKTNTGLLKIYWQYHLKNWERVLLTAIQKADQNTVNKMLARYKNQPLEEDKLLLLATKLHPEALRQFDKDMADAARDRICLLIEQVAFKNRFSLQRPIISIGQNDLPAIGNTQTNGEVKSKQDVKFPVNTNRVVTIHMARSNQTEASSASSSSSTISHMAPSQSTTPLLSTLATKQGQFKLQSTAPSSSPSAKVQTTSPLHNPNLTNQLG
ncbi:MAG TPA: hypothetical protein VHE99_05525 [Gammaproteobacteria bacterium]|nr:hypothetical protein [Gammaproteobacteria bacterium]